MQLKGLWHLSKQKSVVWKFSAKNKKKFRVVNAFQGKAGLYEHDYIIFPLLSELKKTSLCFVFILIGDKYFLRLSSNAFSRFSSCSQLASL